MKVCGHEIQCFFSATCIADKGPASVGVMAVARSEAKSNKCTICPP